MGIPFQKHKETPFLSLKVLVNLSYEDPALSPNFPHLSDWGSFVADTRVCELYDVGSMTACYSPGLLWAVGIKQQLFVNYAGLQRLTKKLVFSKGGGEKSVKKSRSISASVCIW